MSEEIPTPCKTESPALAIIIDSAMKILLCEEKAVELIFSPGHIQIRLPASRRIAGNLKVPHEYILDFYSLMEEEGLITRVERVGIFTTLKGTERLGSLMRDRYPSESAALLGERILWKISGDTDLTALQFND